MSSVDIQEENRTDSDLSERDKFLNWARHKFDEEYFNNFCKRYYGVLRRMIRVSKVIDNNSVIERLSGENIPVLYISNHRSHLDYVQQMYTFWENKMPLPRIAARENVFVGKLGETWEKCGAFKIPFNKMDSSQARNFKALIEEMVLDRESFLIYPEGGRSYSGEIKDFIHGGIALMTHSAKKRSVDYLVVPEFIRYDHPVEEGFFPILEKVKRKSRVAYVGVDAALFLSRYISSFIPGIGARGTVTQYFGKPFLMSECKWGSKEICEKSRDQIVRLASDFTTK